MTYNVFSGTLNPTHFTIYCYVYYAGHYLTVSLPFPPVDNF